MTSWTGPRDGQDHFSGSDTGGLLDESSVTRKVNGVAFYDILPTNTMSPIMHQALR